MQGRWPTYGAWRLSALAFAGLAVGISRRGVRSVLVGGLRLQSTPAHQT